MMIRHLFICSLLLSSCSSGINTNSSLEKNYNAVSDSLSKYKNHIQYTDAKNKGVIKDFMLLDYPTFKEKYDFNDQELAALTATFSITWEIAKTRKEIEESNSKIPGLNSTDANKTTSDTINSYDYKNSAEKGMDKETEVLIEAYDSDVKSTKK